VLGVLILPVTVSIKRDIRLGYHVIGINIHDCIVNGALLAIGRLARLALVKRVERSIFGRRTFADQYRVLFA
jgi:hypothetical protein